MRKLKKDPIREDRINNEAIVDAYGPEERALGWYYYLKNQLRFPFEAKCSAATVVSLLSKGETVQVLRMAPEDVCSDDMLVLIRWHGRTMAVPLSQLAGVNVDQSTAKALGDWDYWVAHWLLFLIYARLPKAHVSMQMCRDPAIAPPCPVFIAHNVLYVV